MVKRIPLTKGQFAVVNNEDYEYLKNYNWAAFKSKTEYKDVYYAVNKYNGFMHRMICYVGMGEYLENREVDHINGNGLDNTRVNLRVVSHRQNCQNRHNFRTSEYPGVSWNKTMKSWAASIEINRESKNLGYFKTEEKAHEAYRKACHELAREKLICEI